MRISPHLSCFCLLLVVLSAACATAAPIRVALCFFGLTRSLHITAANIRHSIIDPLLLNDVEVTIYLHTYNATAITNARSAEDAAIMDWTAFKLLQPDEWQIDDAAAVDRELIDPNLNAWLQHGDAWAEGSEHVTLRNLLKQLHSLKQVTSMWESKAAFYDLAIYLRSDMWFFNQLDMAELKEAMQSPANCIYTPEFHKWGGLNDRLAFGSPSAMIKYGNRLDVAMQHAQHSSLHAERFLLSMVESAGLNFSSHSQLLFERVRATGELWGLPTGYAVVGDDESFFHKRPGLRLEYDQFNKLEFVTL